MTTPKLAETSFWEVQRYLHTEFRIFIEENFYSKISEKARLEFIKQDSTFLKDPVKHIALYSDHGVVHVRDVAQQVLSVIDQVNGILIPKRENSELEFLKGYGLHLAYLHDIGMLFFSDFGRFMHPEFAAQYVFREAFDPLIDLIWNENAGSIAWKLINLFGHHPTEKLKVKLRELLALSVAHSKSKVPIEVVNDLPGLQKHMQRILSTSLEQLFFEQKITKFKREVEQGDLKEKKLEKRTKKIEEFEEELKELKQRKSDIRLNHFYQDFEKEAYSWLITTDEEHLRFVIDILDVIRCLRAADALRQRGTVLRTSAGYEIFVDQNTANAIYALRSKEDHELFLLEGKKPLNAGEANIASSEFDRHGNLRIAMHKGQFKTTKVTKKAAYNVAFTIDDIQADTIQSFERNTEIDKGIFPPASTAFDKIQILIEGVDDNPDFADLVEKELKEMNPAIADRIATRASLQGSELTEVERYLSGKDFYHAYPKHSDAEEMLEKICKSGIPMELIHKKKAFNEVKIVKVRVGDLLIKGGSRSGFVYVPFNNGLKVNPLGGYDSRPAPAWVPIGNTGVIRGSGRNANVYVEKDMHLLMIPKQIYLKYWYTPLNPKQLGALWDGVE